MSLVLPPGVSAKTFEQALDAFAGVVDKQWVLSTDEDRDTYLDAYAPGDANQHVAGAAVGPQSADTKFATSYGPVTNGAIVAFRVEQLVGKAALQPVWISRDMTTPLAPIVANGVLFALASGAQSGKPAVLYALDAATGKELWSSGSTITSHASANAGMAVAASQLYFGTADGTLWTFGYFTEH